MAARASKKTITPRKSKSSVSQMTITEFNQIVDEVEKRFDPKFELIDNKFDMVNKDIKHLNEKIDTKFDSLDKLIWRFSATILFMILAMFVKSFFQ